MVPVLFGVLLLTFIFSRMMPDDPVTLLLAARGHPNAPQSLYDSLRHELGLDQPIVIQFFRYLGNLFTGNWGESVVYAPTQPVYQLIWNKLPTTVDLTIFTMIIASYVGIKVGVISAKHRNKAQDTILRGISIFGVAIPVFFLGLLMQYIFSINLGIFPATGIKTGAYERPTRITGFYIIDGLISGKLYLVWDYLLHMILPVFCLAFITIASITRQTRSSMLEVLEQDYIRTARAKGVREKDVINHHALKNALIPTVTVIGINFAYLLSGAVLTEYTFNLGGIGSLYVAAVTTSDYWLLNAVVFVITLIFVSATLITDLLYALLDPRIRY
jgi:peptide/nickel transport system permease protein